MQVDSQVHLMPAGGGFLDAKFKSQNLSHSRSFTILVAIVEPTRPGESKLRLLASTII